jgi:pimeloyl-ACP methyl ester carboxylesterase
MYVMDYGAPIGYRLALKHPERVSGLIVQNGNAYDEGLQSPFWNPVKMYWNNRSQANRDALNWLVTLEATKFQYTDGMGDVERISPDNWVHDQALLDRPGNRDIQLDMLGDYGSNVPLYPQFQAFFREHQPPIDRLGQERQDLPRRRGSSLSARPSQSGNPYPRLWPFRAGRPALGDGATHSRFP